MIDHSLKIQVNIMINSVTSLKMFSVSAQISYIVFFIVYVSVMYIKNRKGTRN